MSILVAKKSTDTSHHLFLVKV